MASRGHKHSSNASVPATVPGYDVVKALETGSMSQSVNLVQKHNTGELFIEKTIRADKSHKIRANSELGCFLRTSNKSMHLNRLEEHFWGPQNRELTFVLEYCDRGTLIDLIRDTRKRGNIIPEDYIFHIMMGIAKALACLHEGGADATHDDAKAASPKWNSTWHLDIKPDNVFLSSSGQTGPYPRVVLGDFGCAVTANDVRDGTEDANRQTTGMPRWFPPEGDLTIGVGRTRYGAESDMWQLGALIQVLCLQTSKPNRAMLSTAKPVGGDYGRALNRYVKKLTQVDWTKRLTAVELVRKLGSVEYLLI